METPRIDELINQVVSWHNRHGLALRITSTHVRSIGVVVLPFVALDQRLLPAFSEDFIAPLTPKQVASFAIKHGSREHPGAASWSQRVVPVDAGHEAAELALIYLRTASIELGDHRCRVLIGAGPRPKIIGPRAWSVPRVAGASATATAALAGVVMGALLMAAPEAPEVVTASASAARPAGVSASAPSHSFGSASASASAAASALMPVAASAAMADPPDPTAAPRAAIAASAATPSSAASGVPRAASAVVTMVASIALPASAPASAPPPKTVSERDVAAQSNGSRAVPVIRPVLGSEARAAALLEGRRLRAMAPANRAVAAAPSTGHVYAVMTVTTRTRAVAERGHLMMDSSASAGELPGKPHSELMRVADGWRAVLWPFRNRDDAKVAQAMLSERGIRTEVLEF